VTTERRRLTLAPDVLFQACNQEGVMVDLRGGKVFELNQTGARMVELIAARNSIDEIFATLFDEFDVDRAVMQEETSTLIQSLLDRGLVVES
jgi:hypothetical protein